MPPTGDPNPRRGIDWAGKAAWFNNDNLPMTNVAYHLLLGPVGNQASAAPNNNNIALVAAAFSFKNPGPPNCRYGYMEPGVGFTPFPLNVGFAERDVWIQSTNGTNVAGGGTLVSVPLPTVAGAAGTQAILHFSSLSDQYTEVPVQIAITLP